MDNQKNIQQTNITTRKARTNATKPEYKIDNQKTNFGQFPTTAKTNTKRRQPTTTENYRQPKNSK